MEWRRTDRVGEVGGDLGGGAGIGRPVGVDSWGLPGGRGGTIIVVADGDDGGIGYGVASSVAAIGRWEVLHLVVGGAREKLVGVHRNEYHAFLNGRCVTPGRSLYDDLLETKRPIAHMFEH